MNFVLSKIDQFSSFLFVSSVRSPIVFGLERTLLGRLNYFLLISWSLFSYLYALSVLLACGSGPNYVEISTLNSVKGVYDVGRFDSVTSTLSMTFQGTWLPILALIGISALISARLLKFSPGRRFAGFMNRLLTIPYWTYYNVLG